MASLSRNYNTDFLNPQKTSYLTDVASNNSIHKFTSLNSMDLGQSRYDRLSSLGQSQIKITDVDQTLQRAQRITAIPSITTKDIEQLTFLIKMFQYQYQRHNMYKQVKEQQQSTLNKMRDTLQFRKKDIQLQKQYYQNSLIKQYHRIKHETKSLKLKQESKVKNSIKSMKKEIQKLNRFVEQERFNKGIDNNFSVQPHYHFHNISPGVLPAVYSRISQPIQRPTTIPYHYRQDAHQQQSNPYFTNGIQNLSATQGLPAELNTVKQHRVSNFDSKQQNNANMKAPPLNMANHFADFFRNNRSNANANVNGNGNANGNSKQKSIVNSKNNQIFNKMQSQFPSSRYNNNNSSSQGGDNNTKKRSNMKYENNVIQKSLSSGSLHRKSSSRSLLKTAQKVDIFNLNPPKVHKKSSKSWENDGQQNDVLELLQSSQRRVNSGIQYNASRLNYPNSKVIAEHKEKIQQQSSIRKSQGSNIKASMKKSQNSKFTQSKIIKNNSPKNSSAIIQRNHAESQHSIANSNGQISQRQRKSLDPSAQKRENQFVQSRVNIILKSEVSPDVSSVDNVSRESISGNQIFDKNTNKQPGKAHKRRISQQSMPPLPQQPKNHHGKHQSQFRKITEENISDLRSSKMNSQDDAFSNKQVVFPQKILLSQNNQLHISQVFLNVQNQRRQIMNSQIKIQFDSLEDSFEKKNQERRQSIKNPSMNNFKEKLNQSANLILQNDGIMDISLEPISRISRQSPKGTKKDSTTHQKVRNQSSENEDIQNSTSKHVNKIKGEAKSSIDRKGQRIPTNEIQQEQVEQQDDFYRELSLDPLSKISKLKNSSQAAQSNPQSFIQESKFQQEQQDFGGMSSQLRSSTSSKIIKKGKQTANSLIKKTNRNSLKLTQNMQAVAQQQQDDDFDSDLTRKKKMASSPKIEINYGSQSENVSHNRLSLPFS